MESALSRFIIVIFFIIGFASVTTGHSATPPPEPSGFRAVVVPPTPLHSPTPAVSATPFDESLAWELLQSPIPAPSPTATPKPAQIRTKPQTPRPVSKRPSGRYLRGYATYFATGRDGYYGAAGPVLRQWLGKGWRGDHVLVCKKSRCLEVVLNDWCACGKRHGEPTLIDLSDEAFRWLAPLSRGVIHVVIDRP